MRAIRTQKKLQIAEPSMLVQVENMYLKFLNIHQNNKNIFLNILNLKP